MEFSRQQWLTLIVVGIINVYCASSVGIQAPFYPKEAESKGATASEYGFVFGSYMLVNFIVSPFVGKMVNKVGFRRVLTTGLIINSTSVIFFGLLHFVENRIPFIGLSLILRIMESLGASCAVVSGFSLTAVIFPNDVITIFATMETFYGVGAIVAPSVGGFLYALGGFPFPFISVGSMGLILTLCIFLLVPDVTMDHQRKENYRLMSALAVPRISAYLLAACIFSISPAFYMAVLEPFLRRQFGLSSQVISLFFMVDGLVYSIAAPVIGRLIDKGLDTNKFIILGCITIIFSYTIIGPAPFLQFRATITGSVIALFAAGLGSGCGFVATFSDVVRSAKNAGFPETLETYVFITGLWTSSYALGFFIGPSVAGILYDLVGFEWATQFVVGLFIILLIGMIIFNALTKKTNDVDHERSPILLVDDRPAQKLSAVSKR